MSPPINKTIQKGDYVIVSANPQIASSANNPEIKIQIRHPLSDVVFMVEEMCGDFLVLAAQGAFEGGKVIYRQNTIELETVTKEFAKAMMSSKDLVIEMEQVYHRWHHEGFHHDDYNNAIRRLITS